MKKVVFTFGRMNPPTTGHQLLVNKLVAYARQIGAAPRVYLSHSVGTKDPLQYDKKISFARAAFGSLVKKSNARHVIDVLKSLEKEGFTHVTMFAGSDRVPEFTKLLTTYNGKEYNFEQIDVKSAGERDPDADDVSGMSASKMRALAKDDKVAEFLRGAPNTMKAAQAKNMFTAVRRALLGEDVMEFTLDDKFISFVIENDDHDKDDNIAMPSEAEIEKVLKDLDNLDLDDADALMLDLIVGDEEEGEHDEKKEKKESWEITEGVLSLQARQKLAQRMKGMSKRLTRLRQIKAKQMPAATRLRMRARKVALMILRRRASGKKNLDYNALSRSQRIAVDNALINRFGNKLKKSVDAIAKRILPSIRKKAQVNVAKARDIKEQTTVLDPKTGKPVKNDPKDNPLNLDPLSIDITVNDPTQNDRYAPNPAKADKFKNNKMRFKNVLSTEGRKATGGEHVRDAGDTNIIYQMRKTINSRGEHETTFADGHKAHISIADAKKLIAKFDALRMPADKHEFTIQAGQSLAKFRDVMTHGVKHDTKKISLGGRQFKEFYLGVGRSRTVSAYDNDEPPGVRRVAETAKDEDRPTDPNKSRPLSQKMDLLMRLGLVDQEELQKFRRALRSSKKFALQSPQLREKLADLLDKLIDLTTKDPATYSRVRYNVVNKEANALLDKAEKSDLPVDVIYEVFTRGYQINNSFNEAFNRVNSFIAGGKAAQMDEDLKGACWKNYKAVGMKMKNGKKVPNCVPEETQVDEISSGVYKRAMNKAAHRAMWDAEGIHGKKYKKYAPMARKFQKKGIEQEKKEKSRKVNESFSEQLMTTHPAVPLSKRMKRVKSFHAWHPKPVKETYIGAEPASNNPNDPANRFVGTNTIRQNYANVTPGQGSAAGEIAIAKFAPEKVDYSSALIKKTRTEVDQSKENLGQKHLKDIKKALSGIREQNELNESFAAGFELAPFARDYGITVQSSFQHHPEVQAALDAQEDAMNEATYQGREVPLGKPMKGDVKKSKVYVRDPSTGNIKKVNFGDKKLSIKKDQPERKKSYCARSSGQGNLNKKTSANYWSRRAWDC